MTPFPETWTPIPGKPYEALAGEKDALVRTAALPGGYLWQYRKKYGFSPSVEEAKAWVEGLAVHFSIPAAKRWMTIS